MKTKKTNYLLFVGLFLSLCMVSCFGDIDPYEPFDVYAQYQKDSVIIEDYITDNDLQAYNVDSTGVFISIFHHGMEDTTVHPTRDVASTTTTQYVTVGYKGHLVDGAVFDTNDRKSFALSGVIRGWQIGIPEMTKGDSATLLVPSYWAYGNSDIGVIPSNSVLIFDVYLESFERK